MYQREFSAAVCLGIMLVLGCGRGSVSKPKVQHAANDKLATVRLHFEGFTKSKSGATWMAWPNKVKEALVGLEAVRNVEMDIERDEFLVTFDAASANIARLLDATKAVDFPATLVSSEPAADAGDDSFFEEALAKARREQKPVVIDFTAAWCVPCQRMLHDTFPDARVAKLLEECVFVKVDTDEHPELAKRFGVVGLPDIRFLSPSGNEVRRFLDFQPPADFALALQGLLQSKSASLDDGNLTALSEGEIELKEAFNRDIGNVRLVLILSPTWEPCQNGARVVRNSVLDQLKNNHISVYVVWAPVLREDDSTAAEQSVACVPDSRAAHFWDEDKSLGLTFGTLVTLPRNRELAWDVYFVFDGESEWTESPPRPTDWMHQLGLDERVLDGDQLRQMVQKLLPIQ